MATTIGALLLACFASAATPPATAVPDSLRIPNGERFLLRAAARGAQIYTCETAGADRAAFEWKLKAPEAELFDASGASIGRHFAGPSWQLADGSRVVGEVMQRSPVPPSSGCDGAHAGAEERVAYSANYDFYGSP